MPVSRKAPPTYSLSATVSHHGDISNRTSGQLEAFPLGLALVSGYCSSFDNQPQSMIFASL